MSGNRNSDYNKLGFLSPIDVLSEEQAKKHRQNMEDVEQQIGPMHYMAKMHTILRSPYELVVHPNILDVVDQILGPDILLYNATYIIKEPNTPTHVSWHQDLTYWGLDGDDQVSVWLALSAADEQSGCMRMIPGSHIDGRMDHDVSDADETNVLFQSQKVHGVQEQEAVYCPLKPGQASFHHGWTLHSSLPNRSNDRRIGLNIQYIAPHVRQTKLPSYSALLVRGADRFHYYEEETPATRGLDPAALAWRKQQDQLHFSIAGTS